MSPLWVSALITFILALLTGGYLLETRKMRKESIKPNFSLIAKGISLIQSRGSINGLCLRNSGGVARDIDIELKIDNSDEELHVPSLTPNEEVELIGMQDINEIEEENKTVKVNLEFEDGYGEEDDVDLKIDFGEKILLQRNPVVDSLKDIKREIDDIDQIRV